MAYSNSRSPREYEFATDTLVRLGTHDRVVGGGEFLKRLCTPEFRHRSLLSVANSYSRGDREFEKATAMLFPSVIAQRGRMRDHTTSCS